MDADLFGKHKVHVSPRIYYHRIDDYIQGVTTSDTNVVDFSRLAGGDPTPLVFSNVDAEIYGIFTLEGFQKFGSDYHRTLVEWRKRFNDSFDEIKVTGNYDKRFYRMWNYYLAMCAGAFNARSVQLWQFIFTKNGKRLERYDREA
ncbi:Cyclopropane-fatty-acyl-phospholipid synthase [uncultured Candidatus Thioglobus sp.]|nr:Cyclopropane-fatty-acyl-phospholipid synthase [uncultured Candidatus Thioglobus sp.]